MGRRALRPPDPALDLSGHFRLLGEVPCPFAPAEMFGRVAPLEVELGTGKGLFLASAAQERPEVNLVGLEIARKYAQAAAARLARGKLESALVICGDGLRFFREWLTDASVAAVHVYFPDPWWKKRHHKRRVMNEAFVRDVERVLVPGGRLHFWTDVEEYFGLAIEQLQTSTRLAGPLEVAQRAAEHDLDYRTHFERRMRLAGEPVYRSEWVKAE